MHSIRTEILILTLAAILVSVLSVGTVSVLTIRNEGIEQSVEDMRLLCDNNRKTLNEFFSSVEQAVNMVSRYAADTVDSVQLFSAGVIGMDGSLSGMEERNYQGARQLSFDIYLRDYLEDVQSVFHSIANHTNSVITYYYRVNPELSLKSAGFFYTKPQAHGAFVEESLTDVLAYDKDDVEHVGWYFGTITAGRPFWHAPYYNANIDVEMSSYTAPIYRAGTFMGVLGMDIGYDTLVSFVGNIRAYDTGYAFLIDRQGEIIYHPELERGTNIREFDPVFADILCSPGADEGEPRIADTTFQGVVKRAAFTHLSNDLTLIIMAPLKEIDREWHIMVNTLILITACVLVAFCILSVFLVRRLTRPLWKLTLAAENMMHENYDVELDYKGNNEVGVLTKSFQQMADHLKNYLDDLNSKVYKDGMTGVKNKRAFDIVAEQINEKIQLGRETGSHPEIAVIVFDCNGLKAVNDKYGHWKGDEYLKIACNLICQIFASSPVFRLGGDEFSVILQGSDYDRREELLKLFDQKAEEINQDKTMEWECVNAAKGMAVYDPETDRDIRETVNRADAEMYVNKQIIKKEHGRG